MGSPITAMLAQAAPGATAPPQTDVSKMTPEQLAEYMKSLGIESPAAPAPSPSPTPAAPQQEGGSFWQWLMGKIAPSTSSLAPQGQPTPLPPTPEQLAAEQAKRARIVQGQQ